jgi:iron complex outermembrane receptor protein
MVDGVRMSGATRAMEPRSYSSHGADTIEFNKTNSADMDADAPAGSVNLRSKSAFQRSGRYFAWEGYIIHSVYNSLTLGKVDGPNDGQSRPLKPSAVLDYSDVYLKGKLGVALNYGETNGDSTGFGFNAGFVNTAYDTTPTAANPAPVVINNVTWGGGGGSNLRRGGSMNLEYKFTPNLSLALRSQFAWEDNRQQNFQFALIAPRANQAPSANALRMVVNPTTNNTVRMTQTGAVSYRIRDTHSFAPQLTYNGKQWNIDATVAYNREGSYLANRRLAGKGYNEVQSAAFQLFGVGWTLEKDDPGAHAFRFQQTAGPDLYDLHNWRSSSLTNNITQAPTETVTRRLLGQLNAKFTTSWKIPTWFKTGLKVDRQEFFNTSGSYTWTYVGATGNRFTAEIPISVAWPDPRMGGNLFEEKVPVADRLILGTWLKERPEYFIPNPGNATAPANLFPDRSAEETVTAGYLMGNSRFGRLTAQGGIRLERTESEAQNYERGVLKDRSGRYTDPFFSGALRYRFTENRMLIASFSQSIQRPNLNSMSGVLAVNDVMMTGTLPNPNLTPEHGNNYSIRFEQYFEPVGTFSVGYLLYDITDLHRSVPGIPAEDIGLGDDYPGYTFTALSNVGRFKNRGVQIAYRQQLSFLPGVFGRLSVFANYNQYSRSDPELAYRAAPKVIQGGVSFGYGRFSISGQAIWAGELLQDATRYRPPSLTVGTSAYFRLTDRISLTLTGRNISRQRNIQHLRDLRGNNSSTQIQIPSIWILGIKGVM